LTLIKFAVFLRRCAKLSHRGFGLLRAKWAIWLASHSARTDSGRRLVCGRPTKGCADWRAVRQAHGRRNYSRCQRANADI